MNFKNIINNLYPKLKIEDHTDVQTLAVLLDLDPRRIQQLAKEGVIKKNKRGDYLLGESVRNYVISIRNNKKQLIGRELKYERALAIHAKALALREKNRKNLELLLSSAKTQEEKDRLIAKYGAYSKP